MVEKRRVDPGWFWKVIKKARGVEKREVVTELESEKGEIIRGREKVFGEWRREFRRRRGLWGKEGDEWRKWWKKVSSDVKKWEGQDDGGGFVDRDFEEKELSTALGGMKKS